MGMEGKWEWGGGGVSGNGGGGVSRNGVNRTGGELEWDILTLLVISCINLA